MDQSDSHAPDDARTDPPTVIAPNIYGLPAENAPRGDSRLSDKTHPAAAAEPAAPVDGAKTVISNTKPSGDSWSVGVNLRDLGGLLVGKRLGHFLLEEFVGGGGMGAVFRGRDQLLGRTVAIKVLSRDQGADPETLRRFKNEAQNAARLDHENIARVFFVGEDEGWNFIVFEYIDGTNIRELVERRGPLPVELAIDFTVQIAEALAHAAQRDVVHRDIKPSNILV
ncbi:MAG: serine/threonine protein kinase, partial [Planctomycetales bacterium]|nr:serine/threonine protein kinase [Planctomycetales bacterium]